MHCCLFSETELKQSLSSTFSILGKLDPSPTELSVCHTALLRDLKHHDALKMLLELLHEWHEASDTVAKLVVTSIGSYLRQQCSFTSFQQKHDRNLLNRLLLEMFGSRTLPEKYKNLLSRTYSQFIYAQHSTICAT